MKTSIKIITLLSVVCCVACGAKKSTQSKLEKTQEEMATEGTDESQERTSKDYAGTDPAMEVSNASAKTQNEPSSVNANDDGDSASKPAPTTETPGSSQMYSQLEMTKEQIQSLENGLKDFKNRQQNMANGEMLGTVDDEKERLLEEILNAEQYSDFQTLNRDN